MLYCLVNLSDTSPSIMTNENNLTITSYPGNIYSVSDDAIPKYSAAKNWIEKVNGVEKTKEQAQLIINNAISELQSLYDNRISEYDNKTAEIQSSEFYLSASDDDKALLNNRISERSNYISQIENIFGQRPTNITL